MGTSTQDIEGIDRVLALANGAVGFLSKLGHFRDEKMGKFSPDIVRLPND